MMRKNNSHKGENGKLLVIAGSKDYTGAAYLACSSAVAALRTGTDLVTVATPEKVAWTINSLNPDLITAKLEGEYLSQKQEENLLKLIEYHDVLLIGPGIGANDSTLKLVKNISKTKIPKVIDADAIKAVCLQELENTILTPHKGELDIFLKNSELEIEKYEDLKEHLESTVVLLKGKEDFIIFSEGVWVNKSGNPGMTSAGTGDVLAGICAGLLTQGFKAEESAFFSARIMGKIGDLLEEKYGFGFIASDFLSEIAAEVKKME